MHDATTFSSFIYRLFHQTIISFDLLMNDFLFCVMTISGLKRKSYLYSVANQLQLVIPTFDIRLFQTKSKQGGLRIYFSEKPPWKFQICHFTPRNSREKKLLGGNWKNVWFASSAHHGDVFQILRKFWNGGVGFFEMIA